MIDIFWNEFWFWVVVPFLDDHKDAIDSPDLSEESVKTLKDELDEKVH